MKGKVREIRIEKKVRKKRRDDSVTKGKNLKRKIIKTKEKKKEKKKKERKERRENMYTPEKS